MKLKYRFILLFAIPALPIFAFEPGLPLPSDEDSIYHRENYSIHYNELHEQPDWVAYELTAEELTGIEKRRNNFKADREIRTGSATLEDYKGSGFDRGHLAPAADMKMDRAAMNESFLMSNMSPQRPGFNRGIWSFLEACVRTWADENGAVYVVTGPVLNGGPYETIGEEEVAVPEYYYKVILDYREPEKKAIAFVLPNEKGKGELQDYAITVDEAEAFTGLDFFPDLGDEEEERLESELDVDRWRFVQFGRD